MRPATPSRRMAASAAQAVTTKNQLRALTPAIRRTQPEGGEAGRSEVEPDRQLEPGREGHLPDRARIQLDALQVQFREAEARVIG